MFVDACIVESIVIITDLPVHQIPRYLQPVDVAQQGANMRHRTDANPLPIQLQCLSCLGAVRNTCYDHAERGPLPLLQVNPFASAFRPVLPSKRDSNRSPYSPSQTSAAFQPAGTSPPMGNAALQAQLSASSVQVPEAPQAADSADGIAAAATANGSS